MPTTTARRWAALIDQAERSGLTDRAFAEQAGVNPGTFGWWKWHLSTARKTTTVTACFVEVVQEEVPSAPIRLQLDDGLYIEVDDTTDLELLRRVVDALC